MEVVNKCEVPRVRGVNFLTKLLEPAAQKIVKRTLSVAIFIHSSKLELITSLGTLITGGGATDLSCCFCFAVLDVSGASGSALPLSSEDGPAIAFSITVILVLFLRLRFSAASSLMLTDLRGGRAESEVKLASFSGL